jgi:hypothetical protein
MVFPCRVSCAHLTLSLRRTCSFLEIWKGRESFSDNKARAEAIETLKKMIESWLDDFFPQMPKEKRVEMAQAMDMSLIEQKKEDSMKAFYEINNVIRMSFIEMQYMKKVRQHVVTYESRSSFRLTFTFFLTLLRDLCRK